MAATPKARTGEEIWETTTAGRIYVTQTDAKGQVKVNSVGGEIGARLRITALDREINSDQAGDNNAFTNGLLIRVDSGAAADTATRSAAQISTERLMAGFALGGDAFAAFVAPLNELNTRRMRMIADSVDASVAQVAHLDDVIRTKYRIEGDTPTYRDMKSAGDLRSA